MAIPSSVALETKVHFLGGARAQRPETPRLFAITRALLVVTLLAAPLPFGAVQEWAWGTLAVLAFLLLLLWSISSVQQGAARVVWSPLYLPSGLFFVLGLIQWFGHFTMDPVATRESLLKLATDLVLFFLAVQLLGATAAPRSALPPSVERGNALRPAYGGMAGSTARALRRTIVVYAFLLALFAIFQFFSSHGLIYWTVPSPGWTFGPYVNHNHYAGLMEMLIPLLVAGVLAALRRRPSLASSNVVSIRHKASGDGPQNLLAPTGRESSTSALAVFLGFVVLIPVVSLLLSGSRGGLVSLVVEVLLAAVVIFLRGPANARKITAVLGSSALLAAALFFVWMAPRQILERLETVADISHSPEVRMGDRLVTSRDSLRILRDHPWIGAGLGSFETVFPRYQSLPGDLTWDHAHNDYVEALAETGAAGAALILCALALFFWLAFRNLRERLRQTAGWMQFGATLGCCGLLVHSFVDFNLHIPANAAWFAVCTAIATSGVGSSLRETIPRSLHRSARATGGPFPAESVGPYRS